MCIFFIEIELFIDSLKVTFDLLVLIVDDSDLLPDALHDLRGGDGEAVRDPGALGQATSKAVADVKGLIPANSICFNRIP